MGHWTVFCAVTHAPIYDRCVAAWTTPPKYDREYYSDIFNSVFYRGVYDTYGRLDFDSGQKYYDHLSEQQLKNPSLFILESVYDEILKFGVDSLGHSVNDGSAFENSDVTSHALSLLGFQFAGIDRDRERYNYIYVHDSNPSIKIFSDGTWVILQKGKKLYENIFTFKEFQKHFPSIDYSVLKTTSFELMDIENAWGDYHSIQSLSQKTDYCENYEFTEFFRRLNISQSLIPYMEDVEFRKKLADTKRVERFMRTNNLKFGYRFLGGPQDGNIKAHKKLCQLMNIARKTIIKQLS